MVLPKGDKPVKGTDYYTAQDKQEIIDDVESDIEEEVVAHFNTVSDLKSDTSLVEGMVVKTLGYYTTNDGGGSLFKVRTKNVSDVVDEGSIVSLSDDMLVAELISENQINVEQFGTVGNATTDDTTSLKNAVLYCKTNNKILSSAGKRYLLTEDITIKNVQVSFNWGCITSNQKVITLEADEHLWNYGGDRIVIVENMKFTDTNVISSSPAIDLNHLEFSNWHNIALKINSVRSVSDIYYNNDRSDAGTVSIEINVPDKVITKLQGKGGFTGVVIKNSNVTIEDSQFWLSDRNRVNGSLDGSKFIHVVTGSGIMISNCVSDTYQYALYFDQSNIRGTLSNFQQINNNVLYHDCDMYFINKIENLVGNAIVRMTDFSSDNITYHIGSPCLLDILYYDGTPVDANQITNSNVINLLQDYSGNSITSNITMDGYQCAKISGGKLYMYLNFAFNTPNLNKFYLNTSNMAGMKNIRGYQYGIANTLDNNVESLQPFTAERSSNDKILFTNRGLGYFKNVKVCIEFPINL